MAAPKALPSSQLRKVCDPAVFGFTSTEQVAPLDEVIGQERAERAIHLGLNMKQPGYNIFVTGLEGSGKRTIVQDIVAQHARNRHAPDDWCMVNNFDDEFRPKAISMPAGKAVPFAKSMARLIRWLQIKLPRSLESEAFKEEVARRNREFQSQEEQIMQRLQQFSRQHNIHLAQTKEGLRPVPLMDGKPMTREQFDQLPEEQQQTIDAALNKVGEEME